MKKLYMIGNAHLDPVWLWPWQEGFQENKATCRSALDRLKEYADVVFTSSSAQFYEWIEQNDPEMFQEITARIKEGRWILCGGWWVQPDCNIPSGESFARHGLISQNYFKKKFGVIAKTGYNVDSFGHNGMMPQILKLSGMDNYVFMRPGPHEKGLPARNFVWESDDGSRVNAYRIPYSYGTFGELADHIKGCLTEFDPGVDELMCFYGVGNHGGGPTIENINEVKRLQEELKDEVEIIFADPDTYFFDLKSRYDNLPVVHDDLQHHASGCYSAQSEIKKNNRRAENHLLRAEKFSVLSECVSGMKCLENLTGAWKRVLFNQFHDILAGSSIERTYDDTRNEHGEALSVAARAENHGLQAISFKVNIPMEEYMLPVVVFNPHSWEVCENVEIETGMFSNSCGGDSYLVKDSEGNLIPSQAIEADAKVNGRNRIVFPAKVPALGYALFCLYGQEGSKETAKINQNLILENENLKVIFDEKTGGISSMWNKKEKLEFCDGVMGRAAVILDDSDAWSHGVMRFADIEGYFTPVSMKKTEDGEVRSSIRVISKYKNSTLVQTYTLYKEEQMIRVSAKVNWQEKFRCLKIQFPVNLDQYHGTYEIPFGNIEKACNGEEEPVQRWMDLSGIQEAPNNSTGMQNNERKVICGMAVLNDGKYSASMERNRMDLMILRSPVYAHHNPHVLVKEEDDYSFIDQGIQKFGYVLVPHMGTWKTGSIVQKAEELNQPCTSIIETYHKGEYPVKAGYLQIDKENVILSALKKAHDGNGYIARFYETTGENCEVNISFDLFGKEVHAAFRPYEIKTFRFSRNPGEEPEEVNLLEWGKEKELL
ncbi:MAG: alpha-mannosidase [Clostridiales bacterium]|nr:alpha-mannosidase [Clostridiales bacterium]